MDPKKEQMEAGWAAIIDDEEESKFFGSIYLVSLEDYQCFG